MNHIIRLAFLVIPSLALGQTVQVRDAEPMYLPAPVDSNSPSLWIDGQLSVFTSTGMVLLSQASNLVSSFETLEVDLTEQLHQPVWLEAGWQDDDGTILFWYHHEPGSLCPNSSLTAPRIGAAISTDGGRSIRDLGIVLESGDPIDCSARNGYFAGGHGDFSVILDERREYFYFLFSNYGGPAASQGVAMARMAFENRYEPAGAVYKYFGGDWIEPGLGGQMTAIFPAKATWEREDADSFWGPSVHWNTRLGRHVVLLNRACCGPMWPQEGIYAAFSTDLADPSSWTEPKKILDDIGFGPGFYPQVLGTQYGEGDTLAGQTARLFVHGVSLWEITFGL